jgi:glycosyltransferase involved in cell wall biosynthesis
VLVGESLVIGEPFFSIVVPTYNREEKLDSCLKSLARLGYPRSRFEVIVVNDGGYLPDSLAASFAQDLDVKLVHQKHAGVAAARNTGAAHARGEFLAFTDDDCAPDPHWLAALAQSLSTWPDHLIGGRTANALPHNVFSTASQLLAGYVYSYYNTDPHAARFFASNNMSLSADRFRTVGGFDTTYTRTAAEDRDLCDRWRHLGHRMTYAPEAVVRHAHDLTFRAFWRQHFNYGRGAYQFHQARSLRDQKPIKIEPPSFYTNMLRYPFKDSEKHQPVLLAGLLMLSQAANGAGFFSEKLNRHRYQHGDT